MSRDLAYVDVSPLSSAQRDVLWMRLRETQVSYWFDGTCVVVHAPDTEAVREAVSSLVTSSPAVRYTVPRLHHQVADDGRAVAPRFRRMVGFWLDDVVFRLIDATVDRLDLDSRVALVVMAAYAIGATHLGGQTLGKRIVGIEVVAVGTADPPSWLRSAVRWLTPYGPLIAVVALRSWDIVLVACAWTVVVHLPILWDRNGQGLHDRAAHTYVVRTNRGEPHLIAPTF